jgi:hypothetical protein
LIEIVTDTGQESVIFQKLGVINVINKSIDNQVADKSSPAVHAGDFDFIVQYVFFIIAQIKQDFIFS